MSKSKFKIYWLHFKTITLHKWFVMQACFKCGLVMQGITHDLSKYSKAEFCANAKYFQGNTSPIDAEKRERGYSAAWQNHKGRNKHHWQYWTDFENGKLILLRMPPRYVAEMLCDWVGAGKAYNNGNWSIDTLQEWYKKCRDTIYLHKSTKAYIELLIKHVVSERDLYKNWIKVSRINENYALDEIEGCAYQSPLSVAP